MSSGSQPSRVQGSLLLAVGGIAAFRFAAAFVTLLAAFLLTRLTNLMALPVFLDEAIHLDWAFKIAETGRLLGITDGGRYLPIWLYSIGAAPAGDPLMAARLLSVGFGISSLVALAVLGSRLYGSAGAGLVAAALYVAAPSAVLYDRMALVDSLLTTLVLWALVCGERWSMTARLRWALALGAVTGAAIITKLYGALLVLVPVWFLLAAPVERRGPLRRQMQWVHAVVVAVALPLLLDLASTVTFMAENLWLFRHGPDARSSFTGNTRLALLWTVQYLTPAGAALVALAVLYSLVERVQADRVPLAFCLSWGGFFVLTGGSDWFPRYLHPALPPLLLLTANRILLLGAVVRERTGRSWSTPVVATAFVGLFALSAAPLDLDLIDEPARAALPGLDRFQYVEDWPSGYRLDDVADFLEGEAARAGPLVLLREFRSGPLLEGLDLRFRPPRPGIEVVSVHLRRDALVGIIERLGSRPRPVFLALDRPVEQGLVLDLSGADAGAPVAVFQKPGGRRQLEVYRVHGAETPRQVRLSRLPELAFTARAEVGTHTVDSPHALEEARVCAFEDPYRSLDACRRAIEAGLVWTLEAEARYHLGRVFLKQERFEEAAAALEAAIRLVPHDLEQHLAHVEALEALGRHELALDSLRQAETASPDSADLHYRRGWNLARLRRWDEAESALRRSIELDRSRGAFRNDLGVVLYRGGRREEAIRLLLEAVRLDPEDVRARYNLGVALTVAGALRGSAPPR